MLGKARGSKNGSNFLIREIEKADGVDFSRPFCLGYTGLSDELLQNTFTTANTCGRITQRNFPSALWEPPSEPM